MVEYGAAESNEAFEPGAFSPRWVPVLASLRPLAYNVDEAALL
jgi:hypothetical protein